MRQSTEWHSCKWPHAKAAQDRYPFINVSAFLPPPAPATTFLCQRCHFRLDYVWGTHLPAMKRSRDWCMGNTSPEWFVLTAPLRRLQSPCRTCSQRLFNRFEPRVDNQWCLSNLSWIEICLVIFIIFFVTLIILFKWIPMDCVMIWFMQLCWNEKRLRL